MHITKTLMATAAIAALSTTAFAGGLAEEIMEAPVIVQEEMAPAGSSISPAIIVVGLLAALILVASQSGDDEGNIE